MDRISSASWILKFFLGRRPVRPDLEETLLNPLAFHGLHFWELAWRLTSALELGTLCGLDPHGVPL